MSSGLNPRVTAYVDNPCYECDKLYSSPAVLIKHMKKQHDIILESRKGSYNRPASVKWIFVPNEKPYRRTLYGCPSCWFHCDEDMDKIKKHITEIHLDETNELNSEEPDDDIEYSDDDEDLEHGVYSVLNQARRYRREVVSNVNSLSSLFNSLSFIDAFAGARRQERDVSDDEEEEEESDGSEDYEQEEVVTTSGRRVSVAA